jgi:hypothetical protein
MLLDVTHQRLRHIRRKGRVRNLRMVTRLSKDADLILHLNQQHRVPLTVNLTQMMHQPRKRSGIGITNRGAEGREALRVTAMLVCTRG